METTLFLSKKGFKEIKKELARLEHERNDIIASLRDMDKTEIHDERLSRIEKLAQLDSIESDIHEKQQALKSAKLLPSKRDRLKVAIGSVVELADQQGRLFRYTLVDSLEANPSDGRISIKSPLGQSLLGRTIKEDIEWIANSSVRRLQLVNIS
jgi:transcription elongation factor GreA